jgi:hypothetical protein
VVISPNRARLRVTGIGPDLFGAGTRPHARPPARRLRAEASHGGRDAMIEGIEADRADRRASSGSSRGCSRAFRTLDAGGRAGRSWAAWAAVPFRVNSAVLPPRHADRRPSTPGPGLGPAAARPRRSLDARRDFRPNSSRPHETSSRCPGMQEGSRRRLRYLAAPRLPTTCRSEERRGERPVAGGRLAAMSRGRRRPRAPPHGGRHRRLAAEPSASSSVSVKSIFAR